jgi:hypothetical protein
MGTNVSKEPAASIFKVEEYGCMFFRKDVTSVRGVISQKTVTLI